MPSIETCLSPALFPYRLTKSGYIMVVVDVLRATTAFCAALDRGFGAIIPVADIADAIKYREAGFQVAAEREGDKLDFAHFGNSPAGFLAAEHTDAVLAYTTTNGTQAIKLGKDADQLITASFSNLSAATEWIQKSESNVLILCAGWKNTFSLEDTLCAGAIADRLLSGTKYSAYCDATEAAVKLWQSVQGNPVSYVSRSLHYRRLLEKGLTEDLSYCFRVDTSNSVPLMVNGQLIKAEY